MNGLFKLATVIFLATLLFLVIDVSHRLDGYRAAHGHGIQGTITVTGCEKHRTGTFCVGDFRSADRQISRSQIRVNGAVELLGWSGGDGRPDGPARLPAVVADPDADEAWTLDGAPWLRPSMAQLTALLPIAAAVVLFRGLLRDWHYQRMRRRMMRGGMAMAMIRGRKR